MLTLTWDQPVVPGFIVFEGLDGAGTTTQARRLAEEMISQSIPAHFTCEPTDLPSGRAIRAFLAGPEHAEAWTLALLFAADRYEHLHHANTGILARIAGGDTVVCDRYLFSSLAYQGTDADFSAVEELNAHFPLPEHLVFLDTSRDEAERRLKGRRERDVLEHTLVQDRVAARYRGIVEAFSDLSATKVHIIGGDEPPEQVFSALWKALKLPQR